MVSLHPTVAHERRSALSVTSVPPTDVPDGAMPALQPRTDHNVGCGTFQIPVGSSVAGVHPLRSGGINRLHCHSAPVPSESLSHAGMVESGSAPALPATSSTESPAAQQSHDDCPVSHALPTDAAPKDMRPVMAASAQPVPWIEGWRGNDALWVGLPAQTTVPAQPDPDQAGWLVTKFP